MGVGCCARSLLLHAGFSQLQALGLLFMAVRRLLTEVAFRCRAKVPGVQASVAKAPGSMVAEPGLSCSMAYGIFPDQEGTRVP